MYYLVGYVVAVTARALAPLAAVLASWVGAAMILLPFTAVFAPVLGLVFLFNYGVAAARNLVPERFGLSRPRPIPEATGEPALRPYFFRQAYLDYRAIVRESLQVNFRVMRGDTISGFGRWLLTGKGENARRPSFDRNHLAVACVVPFGLVFWAGVGASIALFLLLCLALGIIHLGLLGVITLVCAVSAIALRGLDSARLLIRKIRITCPHPGCYERIALPEYECRNGSCRRRHRKLAPGVYGILHRRCICGASLPTLFMLGRHEIVGFCPVCNRPLPDRSGSARAVHLPVVGGPSAGKTMLMMSIAMTLERLSNQNLITFSFATESDRRDYRQAKALLEQGLDLAKTVVQLPRAFMIYVGSAGGPTRLLYLYDPAGEYYQSSDLVRQQLYLRHATGLLFVMDPFSAPLFMAGLRAEDGHIAAGARPSGEDPESAYHRLIGNLRSMLDELRHKRLAVIVSKTDALERLRIPDGLPIDGRGIREWIRSIGLGNLIRSMEHDFGEVSYFRVSARQAAGAPSAEPAAVEPLLWLLQQSGLDLRPSMQRLVRSTR